jgi:hypothetical protein
VSASEASNIAPIRLAISVFIDPLDFVDGTSFRSSPCVGQAGGPTSSSHFRVIRTVYGQIGHCSFRSRVPCFVLAFLESAACGYACSKPRFGPPQGERLYVIPAVAGAGAAGPAGRGAWMLPLEFARHLARSVFPRRRRGGSDSDRDGDDA